MKVLVTGSRSWDDRLAVNAALIMMANVARSREEGLVVIHGAARGADTMAHDWAKHWYDRGRPVQPVAYPADWSKGKRAGMDRNRLMVDENPDIDYVLAFPLGESKGTRGCMKYAESKGLLVINLGDK